MTGGVRMHGRYMEIALSEARDAATEGEIPVGAVIVKDGEVIASAHNKIGRAHV